MPTSVGPRTSSPRRPGAGARHAPSRSPAARASNRRRTISSGAGAGTSRHSQRRTHAAGQRLRCRPCCTSRSTTPATGTPVVLLHGLTATRRYVVMGSTALQRARPPRRRLRRARPRRVGRPRRRPTPTSTPTSRTTCSTCSTSAASTARCSPARRWARTPRCASRSSTPSASPASSSSRPPTTPTSTTTPERLARWDALAEGLRTGGVEGFVEAYGDPRGARAVARHGPPRHPPAPRAPRAPRGRRRRAAGRPALAPVRDARRPRARSTRRPSSSPSRDEADPGHPLARRRGATPSAIPGAELVVEEEGKSPIAWQGGQLSRVIAELAARVARRERRGLQRHAAAEEARRQGGPPGRVARRAGAASTRSLGALPDGVAVQRAPRQGARRARAVHDRRARELAQRLPKLQRGGVPGGRRVDRVAEAQLEASRPT